MGVYAFGPWHRGELTAHDACRGEIRRVDLPVTLRARRRAQLYASVGPARRWSVRRARGDRQLEQLRPGAAADRDRRGERAVFRARGGRAFHRHHVAGFEGTRVVAVSLERVRAVRHFNNPVRFRRDVAHRKPHARVDPLDVGDQATEGHAAAVVDDGVRLLS